MEGIKRTGWGYVVNGFNVSRHDKMWDHTEDRVKSFEKKCNGKEDFTKKMVTRLKRITKKDKIYYTIAVLVDRGHHEVAEIYDSNLVMLEMTADLDFLNDI